MDRDRNEALIAEKLDDFFTACQSGQNASLPPGLPLAETALADELVALAETIRPDSAFITSLDKRLRRSWRPMLPLLPVWRNLSSAMERHKTFSQLALTLTGAVVLALLLFFGLPLLTPRQGLPRLPSLKMLDAYLSSSSITSHGKLPPDVEFMLETELPPSPRQVLVFRQARMPSFTIEEIHRWAKRFGVRGQVYKVDPYESGYYAVLDGPRRVIVGGPWIVYLGRSILQSVLTIPLLPPEQAAPVAEGFLRERGLLDSPFRVEPCLEGIGAGNILCFIRLADGHPVRNAEVWGNLPPEIQALAGVAPDGQVAFIFYRPVSLAPGSKYPIRSAQAAWEALRSGQPANLVLYVPRPDRVRQGAAGSIHHPKYWTPQYRPGRRVDLHGGLEVFRPVEGDGPPVLEVNGVLLSGPWEELRVLSKKEGNLVHVWGLVRQDAPGAISLEVTGWKITPRPSVSFSFGGVIDREDELVLLRDQYGETFVLPHAPGDLADGLAVSVFGWPVTEREEAGYPVLSWMYMESQPEAGPPDSRGGNTFTGAWEYWPPGSKAFIEQVELIYYALPTAGRPRAIGDAPEPGMHIVQPMWCFAGHTEDGWAFEVLVQAVRDEYLMKESD